MRRKLVAGNWKMNGTAASLEEARKVADFARAAEVDVLICPPFTLVSRMHDLLGSSGVLVGAQDCHTESSGAHTGDISAAMLRDAGASHVILGHSERRQEHGEADELVKRKIDAAWEASMTAILCVGESEAMRIAGRTNEVVGQQLARGLPEGGTPESTVIAYEPIWAIGTGNTPSASEIAEVHAHIRSELAGGSANMPSNKVRILYGGSVNPGNAAEIFAIPDVDGALVGGASLKAADFNPIVGCAAP